MYVAHMHNPQSHTRTNQARYRFDPTAQTWQVDLDLDSTRIQVDALGHTPTDAILLCLEAATSTSSHSHP